ncbi:AsmA family protein [Polaromonas sp. YR568]|uniref:AsmA family protein n=1 Tax=Polaromonas sp. YR568 TaxID=1855301 RepID=UPI0031377C8E
MTKVFKWLVIAALALMLLLAATAFTLHRWIGTDDFRGRLEREASSALGVPVALGNIAVDVWPLPAVALSGIEVKTAAPITVGRVEVRPLWRPLLSGRLEVATLLVRRAVIPQRGVDAVMLAMQKKTPEPAAAPKGGKPPTPATDAGGAEAGAAVAAFLPRRTVLDDVTWVSVAGARTTVQADAQLGSDGLPDNATFKLLKGHPQGLQATLVRKEAAPDLASAGHEWVLKVNVGGGTVEGPLGLQRAPGAEGRGPQGGVWVLKGQLKTQGVEVSALTAPSKTLTGLLDATTTLQGRAASTAALAEALQTQTTFTVRNAVLDGIDLAKAVQTVGISRGGQTRIDTLAGQVTTQGKAVQLSNLVASSGALSATGSVAISPAKALSGRVTVAVAGDTKVGSALGGAVGVPLTVGGTIDKPEVSLSRSALVGAAIGTALLPGVGTGAGANIGDRMGEGLRGLFGK